MTRTSSTHRTHHLLPMALAFLLATAGLTAVAAPAHADPPTGGSLVVNQTFKGATVPSPSWTVQGDTCLTGAASGATPPAGAAQIPSCVAHRTGPVPPMNGAPDGYLQLTDAAGNRAGSILYNLPLPATAGMSVTFDQYQYGGNGADGIGFFLVDGSTSLTATGGLGGSLGYAQRNNEPGVRGGYVGVGLDAYGNFYNDSENRGAGCPAGQRSPTTVTGPTAPNVITLRGPGSGTSGYCWLNSTVPTPITNPTKPGTTLKGGTGTLRAATLGASLRTVNVQITPDTPDADPFVIVQVQYTPGGPWITELNIPAPRNAPTTYKLGFSASTGGSNDIHLIRNVQVQTVLPLDSLNIEKQVDRTGATALPAVITAGTAIPYQYTVTNTGAPVSALTVADNRIPAAGIVCQATSLTTAPAVGSTTTCKGSYIVTAADVAAGNVVNSAVANATSQLGDPVQSAPATVTVPLLSSMTIAKAVNTPGPYSIGQQVGYTYTLTNTGGSILRGFPIADDRMASSAITCVAGSLDPGASTTCTGSHPIGANQINTAGYLVNTASVTAQTPIGQTVTAGPAQVQIPVATDVGVTKTVDDPAPLVGSNVTFTVTATGNGPATATGVVVTDFIPVGGLAYVSSTTTAGTSYESTTGRWSIPSLAPGTSATLAITATVNTGAPYTNSAVRTATDQPDRDSTNDSSSVTINPVTPTMDIAVSKTVDRPQIPLGGKATFTVVATNGGPFAGTGVQVRDVLPSGLTYDPVNSSGDGTYDPATGLWDIGALAVGQSAVRTIAVVGNALGTYTNIAALTGTPSPPDTNPTNNSDFASISVVLPLSDLAVVKTVLPLTAVVGDRVTYRLDASNLGPDAAVNVTVSDNFPAGVTVINATTTKGTISADGTTWTIGALAVGEQGVSATVTALITDSGTQVNTASIDSPDVNDPDVSNNSSAAAITSSQPDLDIAVGKTVSVPSGASSDAVPIGEDVEFTLTAENVAGGVTATELVLKDRLPAGFAFVSSVGDRGGAYDPVTGNWTLASLAAGDTAQLTITATVIAAGSFVNTVSLSSLTQNDSDPSNNSADVRVTAVVLADVAITKSVDPATTARPGDIVTYRIEVSNNGPNDATGVEAIDPQVTAATIVDFDASTGTFDPVTRAWFIGDLAAGADPATLTVDVQVTRPGQTRNTVAVTGTEQPDPDLSNNTAYADLFVAAADIAVAKRVHSPQVFVGQDATFSVDVWNYGPDASGVVLVNDVLPAGLTFVSADPSIGAYDLSTGVWTIPALQAADLPGLGRSAPLPQATLTIVARVNGEGSFANAATSPRPAPAVFDPDPTNNTASAIVTGVPLPAELHVAKSVDPASVFTGGAATFTIVVSNAGPADAEDVALQDRFPAGVTPLDSETSGCTITDDTLTCDLGSLAVDDSVTVVVTATVDAMGSFTNTASVSTSTPLTPTSTTTASATVTAVAQPGGGWSGGGSSGGPGSLPATGGVGAGPAPLVAVLLVTGGLLLLRGGRRRDGVRP